MDSGKKLEQGNIVHASNPKAGLPSFVFEYDMNYLSDLEAIKTRNKSLPQIQWGKYWS